MNSFAFARATTRVLPPRRPAPPRPAAKETLPSPPLADRELPLVPPPATERPARHFLRV